MLQKRKPKLYKHIITYYNKKIKQIEGLKCKKEKKKSKRKVKN